jgi:uncharacterized protein related to proFAR isomerase
MRRLLLYVYTSESPSRELLTKMIKAVNHYQLNGGSIKKSEALEMEGGLEEMIGF